MNRTARNLLAATAAAATITLTGAFPASAEPNEPASSVQADDDDNGLWGLLGLVGLLGLAGLARRGPKSGAMAGYPAAGRTSHPDAVPPAEPSRPGQAPPMNTYPPAEPRRNPPGA